MAKKNSKSNGPSSPAFSFCRKEKILWQLVCINAPSTFGIRHRKRFDGRGTVLLEAVSVEIPPKHRPMKTIVSTLLAALLCSASASADVLVESYVAFLSRRDHFNSNGDRLDNAAAIIRQDRANFHKYGKRDEADQGDAFFAIARNREVLERYLNRGRSPKAALNAIVNGTPMVVVKILHSGDGEPYITVSVSE